MTGGPYILAAAVAAMLLCCAMPVTADSNLLTHPESARKLQTAKPPSGGSGGKSSGPKTSAPKNSGISAPKATTGAVHTPPPVPAPAADHVEAAAVAPASAAAHQYIHPSGFKKVPVGKKVPMGSPPPRAAGDGWLYGGGHDVLVENVEPGRRMLSV